MLLAAFCYTVTGAVVRYLADSVPVFEVIFFRSLIAVALMAPLVMRSGLSGFKTTRFPLHLLRLVLMYAGFLAWFYGVTLIPLADYYALQFLMPIFTIAGAVLFLGEHANWRHMAAIAVGFAGALIILRPGLIEISLGALGAIGAAVTFASVNVCSRVLSRTDSVTMIVTYSNLMVLPLSLLPALPGWITPDWTEAMWILCIGVVGTLGQFSITRAVAVADARIVQPFDFARLPFAAVIGYFVFDEIADGFTWTGAVIIFAAATYVLRIEGRVKRSNP